MSETTRSRLLKVLKGERPEDRLPIIEWAHYWGDTIDRWHEEGLPRSIDRADAFSIREYFGMDNYRLLWFQTRTPETPEPPRHGYGVAATMDEYREVRKTLFPEQVFEDEVLAECAAHQETGEWFVWAEIEGFFYFPRALLGIECHLYSFYDQPEVMHEICRDLLEFNLRAFEQCCEICVPDFVVIAEDMAYNSGPMISKDMFDEFIAPYYHEIIPALVAGGTVPIVDSDGDVTALVPWLEEVGVQGSLPLEVRAGCDVNQCRRDHPDFTVIGSYDKMAMFSGEETMREEFERLMPAMRSGRFIPSVDHQTPPQVSLENYRIYLRLLEEYAIKAVQ